MCIHSLLLWGCSVQTCDLHAHVWLSRRGCLQHQGRHMQWLVWLLLICCAVLCRAVLLCRFVPPAALAVMSRGMRPEIPQHTPAGLAALMQV